MRIHVTSSAHVLPVVVLVASVTLLPLHRASAQDAVPSSAAFFKDEFVDHFRRSSSKMTALSQAMPAELYDWSPAEGVMSVATVYAHIARYNYYYLASSLGIPAPEGVDVDGLESLTDKSDVREALVSSVAHVNDHVSEMSEADLTRTVRLYGRDVQGWEVLLQLLAHMNEHVGQSVAYARMNGVTPPWSR